jgi:hypothetical protein
MRMALPSDVRSQDGQGRDATMKKSAQACPPQKKHFQNDTGGVGGVEVPGKLMELIRQQEGRTYRPEAREPIRE